MGRSRRGTPSTSIQESKSQPFFRVLFGLNIPDVGWVTAQNLTRHFGSVDRLMEASQEDIMAVEGIGPERAEAIAEWFSDEENRGLVQELRELGLTFEVGEAERPVEGRLTGSTYVITGTLSGWTREEAIGGTRGARCTRAELCVWQDDRPRGRGGAGVEAREGGEGRRSHSGRGRLPEAPRELGGIGETSLLTGANRREASGRAARPDEHCCVSSNPPS